MRQVGQNERGVEEGTMKGRTGSVGLWAPPPMRVRGSPDNCRAGSDTREVVLIRHAHTLCNHPSSAVKTSLWVTVAVVCGVASALPLGLTSLWWHAIFVGVGAATIGASLAQWYINCDMERRRQKEDPALSPTGVRAARERGWTEQDGAVSVILVSPLRRALQTAQLLFSEGSHRIIAVEWLREELRYPCDQRGTLSQMVKDFPSVDFSLIRDEEDPFDVRRDDYALRARETAHALLAGDNPFGREGRVVLVGHGRWIREFLEELGEVDIPSFLPNLGTHRLFISSSNSFGSSPLDSGSQAHSQPKGSNRSST
eukprot:Hpha_TRINITY_DN34216_c0_g1::TRINITY_DN34216_c0_g1_i1::g.34509::m.34509